jgi:hypothetical protein
MTGIFNSENRAMSLVITITCSGAKRFRVYAQDYGKANSYYADREIDVDNKRTIYFSFPVSPKSLLIGCFNVNDENDSNFKVDVKEAGLKKYNIWLDSETKDFCQLAINFSQICGFNLPQSQKGIVYQTPDAQFNIKYFPVIKDYQTGKVLGTPARIGHSTGIIEVAANKFMRYTIPMRVCILLHEYSHKYKNPKIGLQVSNEIGADINGLYIYLGLGFSKIDAICVFANVFLKAQTEQNMQRMRKIIDYINRFENQEYAEIG